MAKNMECSDCEHVQLVGFIENGLSGYPDPHAKCAGCGAVGKFHFLPGAAARRRREAADIAAANASIPQRSRVL